MIKKNQIKKNQVKKTNKEKPSKETKPGQKVYWDGKLMNKGQIGRVKIEKPTNLWERDENGKLTFIRVLKQGETHPVYSKDNLHSGQFGVGEGQYITDIKGHVKYETPSKQKLAQLND